MQNFDLSNQNYKAITKLYLLMIQGGSYNSACRKVNANNCYIIQIPVVTSIVVIPRTTFCVGIR